MDSEPLQELDFTPPISTYVLKKIIERIDFEGYEKEITKKVIANVDEYLKDKDPELLCSFNDIYGELTDMMNGFQKSIAGVEKKLKKMADSQSLYEDVYKLRDEVKEVNKFLDKFKKISVG